MNREVDPTPPPIELPMMSTGSRPSASTNVPTAPNAVTIGWPPKSSLTPKPGNSSTRQRKCVGEGARDAAKVAPAGDAGTGAVQEQQGVTAPARDSGERPPWFLARGACHRRSIPLPSPSVTTVGHSQTGIVTHAGAAAFPVSGLSATTG